MSDAVKLKKILTSGANASKAKTMQKFFKIGPGQYAEGDIFLGWTMPQIRSLAKKYSNIDYADLKELLWSQIHEERMLSLIILTIKFKNSQKLNEDKKLTQCFEFYLENRKYINNWDLIDVTAPTVIGEYLLSKKNYADNEQLLFKFARSKSLWERRIAIISTFAFIKNKEFSVAMEIAKTLLSDKHDLIHKAVGWMLREIGKRNESELIRFLDKYAAEMPRVMLRYAIEKFPENKRKIYLNKK